MHFAAGMHARRAVQQLGRLVGELREALNSQVLNSPTLNSQVAELARKKQTLNSQAAGFRRPLSSQENSQVSQVFGPECDVAYLSRNLVLASLFE